MKITIDYDDPTKLDDGGTKFDLDDDGKFDATLYPIQTGPGQLIIQPLDDDDKPLGDPTKKPVTVS